MLVRKGRKGVFFFNSCFSFLFFSFICRSFLFTHPPFPPAGYASGSGSGSRHVGSVVKKYICVCVCVCFFFFSPPSGFPAAVSSAGE